MEQPKSAMKRYIEYDTEYVFDTGKVVRTKTGFGINLGNKKMGPIPSFSVTPIRTCNRAAPCTVIPDGKVLSPCYAHRMVVMYPEIRDMWHINTELIMNGALDEFVNELSDVIRAYGFREFRFHVGGDYVNADYFKATCKIADICTGCKFFAFTKKFDLIEQYGDLIPSNYNIVLSAWGNFQPSDKLKDLYAVSYVVDPKRGLTAPKDAFPCAGECYKCRHCITARQGSVFFTIH